MNNLILKNLHQYIEKIIFTYQKVTNTYQPWFTYQANKRVHQLLKSEWTGFEFGSGHSTMYFSKKVKHLVSVEHNPEWYGFISEKIKQNHLEDKVTYLLRPRKNEVNDQYPYTFENHPFRDYFNAIKSYPDNSFDFIVIDGKARLSCLVHSIDKLKSNGIIIFDNSDREKYQKINTILSGWNVETYQGISWETKIFFKP